MYVIKLPNDQYLSPSGTPVPFDKAEEFYSFSDADQTALEYNLVEGKIMATVVASAIVPYNL